MSSYLESEFHLSCGSAGGDIPSFVYLPGSAGKGLTILRDHGETQTPKGNFQESGVIVIVEQRIPPFSGESKILIVVLDGSNVGGGRAFHLF